MRSNDRPLRCGLAPFWPAGIHVLAAAGMLFFAGCVSPTTVKIDSPAKLKATASRSYSIQSARPLAAKEASLYKVATGLVKSALSAKGMEEAPDPQRADFVVNLDFGVGPPQTRRETRAEPVFVTVPGAVEVVEVADGVDVRGNPIYRKETRRDPPTTELKGFQDQVVTYTVYEKYVRLTARLNRPATPDQPTSDLWTIDATSEGESRDLRKQLPFMMAAISDCIGQDSRGPQSVRIKDGNARAMPAKKGM